MAQFSSQGRLKLLINGDGVSNGLDSKDPFPYKLVVGSSALKMKGRMLKLLGSTRLHSSSSSSAAADKSRYFIADASVNVSDDGVYDEYDSETEVDELASFRGLVLDISYRPVNVVCWKRAICLEFMEKADVLEYYDRTVNSPSGSYYIPAVLRVPHLLQVVKRRRIKTNLSRKNILYRDNFTCQYCSSRENLTIDHVLPVARGGEWEWENLALILKRDYIYTHRHRHDLDQWVTACSKCNSKKGRKTLEEAYMKLTKIPKAPKEYEILAIPLTSDALMMLRMRKGTPDEWHQYLSKPSSDL